MALPPMALMSVLRVVSAYLRLPLGAVYLEREAGCALPLSLARVLVRVWL